MASMFELLLDLPLFRGATHNKLAEIVGETKFHFLKYPDGETVIRSGEPCTHLTFVISGSVRSTIVNTNGRFAVSQTLEAPAAVAPDFFFGRLTNYPCDVTAIGDVSVLKISKADFIRILNSDTVFLFNYLNYLSVNAQKAQQGVLALTTGDIDERIAFWIVALSQPEGKDIVLSCRKRDLCSLFGMQRAAFEAGLNSMKERGLLDFNNTELFILDRAALRNVLLHNHEASE